MRLAVVAIAVVVAFGARDAHAGPPKVMVLPLDGNADAPTRAKFSASVQRLARVIDGKVTPGTASFTESATVIGCDPAVASCAENVRATLGVDELVYGTLTADKGQLVIVVRRTAKGKPPREITVTVGERDPPERAEPALLPLFHGAGEAVPPLDRKPKEPVPTREPVAVPEPAPSAPVAAPVDPPRPRRTLGIAAIAGGGTLMLIGFVLWSSAGSLQSQVDKAVPEDRDDFDQLIELEDRASTRAWTGNALVVVGLALGTYGGYLIYKDRKAPPAVLAPAPVPGGGVGLVLSGVL